MGSTGALMYFPGFFRSECSSFRFRAPRAGPSLVVMRILSMTFAMEPTELSLPGRRESARELNCPGLVNGCEPIDQETRE